MVVGTLAGFTPAGSMILIRGGDDEVATGDKLDTHLKSYWKFGSVRQVASENSGGVWLTGGGEMLLNNGGVLSGE